MAASCSCSTSSPSPELPLKTKKPENRSTKMCDTPVRHDEVSFTRTSLRSRILVSAINYKAVGEKVIKATETPEKKDNRTIGVSLAVNSKELSSSAIYKGENCDLISTCDTSVMTVDNNCPELATHCEDIKLGSDHVNMEEESFAVAQKHSTPSVKFTLRSAVSSTPNQETFNNSKLTRNVASQTIFTLSARDPEEMSDDLKHHFKEVTEEGSDQVSVLNSTSPLRNFCSSRLIKVEKTPVRKNQFLRKLSLRSKTMICSAIEKSRDKPNNVLTGHKSAEEKSWFSNTFSLMPHLKTPPQYTEKVLHNPFETDLTEKLSKSMFSPNVFDNVMSPSEDSEYLRWTIEDVSSINPVPIEENLTFPSDDEDPERESQVQLEIERYFSETHFVLSPHDMPIPSTAHKIKEGKIPKRATASTPQKVVRDIVTELDTASTQTNLALPVVLSDKLEESLKSYFKIFQNDDFNLSASSLRRKLFFHSEDEPPSPVKFDFCSSPIVAEKQWQMEQSPFVSPKKGRHFTPVTHHQDLSSPDFSPVVDKSMCIRTKNSSLSTCKKTLHLYFTGNVNDPSTKGGLHGGPVVNSTVLVNTADSAMSLDCSGEVMSVLPSSQDTGYQTEKSSTHLQSPYKLLTASTPTHR